ncbi:MAG: DUF2252 domain-containing protein [Actinomycetes bacterium]
MTTRWRIPHPSVDQRLVLGEEARDRTPLSSHRGWAPAMDRPDPVALLEEQDATREPDLVPVRHGRMMLSPFTFYRGAANFTIAGRNNGFATADTRTATRASVAAYREAMAGFAAMGTMEIWYAHLAEDQVPRVLDDAADASRTRKGAKAAKQAAKTARKEAAKARTRDSLQALSKLAEQVDGQYRIVSRPPIIVPARDLEATYGIPRDKMEGLLRDQFRAYRATLRDDHRQLLERFEPVDMARKVVGVGSVGTLAYIVLLQGRDQHDPLFLQLKEASASVLEDHLPASRYRHHGERVLHGQRMLQAASDIYLGWTQAELPALHHFYWRQLRDMKGSPDVEAMVPATLAFYGRACGWTLARAHARSGDPIAIAAYLGESDQFDRSMADFSERYADQNERDHQAFVKAIHSGRLQALEGV